jgi:hypothetical protein
MFIDHDDMRPTATPGEAHAEWHRNAGVPMGTPGCPQDGCYDTEAEDAWNAARCWHIDCIRDTHPADVHVGPAGFPWTEAEQPYVSPYGFTPAPDGTEPPF